MMTKFEYMEISFKELKTENFQNIDTEKLNAVGKDGWELVSIGGQCLFKRQVIE